MVGTVCVALSNAILYNLGIGFFTTNLDNNVVQLEYKDVVSKLLSMIRDL